ncbi:MAG: tetratricopeptide repeat protein [Candidatus Omnitrophica bacterium]|nr:tetratricopeptide repeat protein [Candidatus Omnitrophota bacterium]
MKRSPWPKIGFLLLFAAVLTFSLCQSSEAWWVFKKSYQPPETNVKAHYDQARIYFRKGEYSQAQEQFEKVLELQPNHQGAKWYLKLVQKELEKYEKTFPGRVKKVFEKNQLQEASEVLDFMEKHELEAHPELVTRREKLTQQREQLLREKERLEVEKAKLLSQKEKSQLEAERRIEEKEREQEEAIQRLEKRIKAEREKELQEKINFFLSEGKYYYKEKAYLQAKEEFDKALQLDYKNKEARKYLHKIEKDIAEEKRERLLARRREEERLLEEQKRIARRQEETQRKAEKEAEEKRRKLEEARRRLERKIKAEKEEKQKEAVKFHMGEGLHYYKEKRFEQAQEQFEKVLAIEDTNRKASKYLRKIEKIIAKKKRKEMLVQRREVEYKARERDEALQQAEERLRKEQAVQERLEKKLAAEKQRMLKGKIKILLGEGKFYYKDEAYEQAQREFEQVLALDSTNREARNYLVKMGIYDSQQMPVETPARIGEKEHIQQVRQDYEENLVQFREEKKSAREKYKEEKLLKKGKIEIYLEQAKFYYKHKAYEKAQEEFENVLAVDKNNKAAHRYLVKMGAYTPSEKKEQADKGAKVILPALGYKEELARLRMEKKTERDEFLDEKFERPIRKAEEAQRKSREEKQLAKEEQRQLKAQIDNHLYQGKLYYKQKHYEEAKESFNQVLALDSVNKKALKYLRKVDKAITKRESQQLAAKRQEEERQLKEERLRAKEQERERKDKIRMYFDLGKAYYKQKKYEKAKEKFEEIIVLDQSNKEAQGYLDRIEQAMSEKEQELLSDFEQAAAAKTAEIAFEKDKKKQSFWPWQKREDKVIEKERTKRDERRDIAKGQQEKLEEEINIYLAQGKSYYAQKDYLSAEEAFKHVLALDYSDKQALKYLTKIEEAIAKIEREKFLAQQKEQERLKKEKEKLRQERIEMYLSEAKIYYQENEYRKAKEVFDQVLALDYANKEALKYLHKIKEEVLKEEREQRLARARGEVEIAEGHAQEKEGLLEQKERKLQENIDKYLEQGRYYYEQKHYEEAKESFNQALALDYANKTAFKYLSKIEEEIARKEREEFLAKRNEEERKQEEKERQNKEEIRMLISAGEFYYKQGAYSKAKDKFNKVLDLDYYNKDALKYLRQIEAEVARRKDEQFLARKRADQEELGEYQGQRLAQEEQHRQKEKIEIYLTDGIFYYKQNAYQRAKEKFNQALALDASNAKAHEYLRKIDQAMAQMEREEFLAKRKDEEKLQKIKLLYEKGEAYLQHGLFSEAIACFEEAVALEGKR